jgi:hypothetical protein
MDEFPITLKHIHLSLAFAPPLHSVQAKKMKLLLVILPFLPLLEAFAPCASSRAGVASFGGRPRTVGADRHQQLHMINQKRRVSCSINLRLSAPCIPCASLTLFYITQQNELGLPEDADEYDLDVALNNNTDAGITKIIAGSFILVMLALLVVGLVIPSITDYGDGVCSPIQNGGRC